MIVKRVIFFEIIILISILRSLGGVLAAVATDNNIGIIKLDRSSHFIYKYIIINYTYKKITLNDEYDSEYW